MNTILIKETFGKRNSTDGFDRAALPASVGMIDPVQADNAIRAGNRRRYPALLLHYAVRLLGYVEFTDIYCIDPRTPVPRRDLHGYEIGPADGADLDYMCHVLTRDQPPHVLRKRWQDGHHCLVARHQEQVVAYDWIALSAVQEQEYRIELDAQDAFCLDAYTVPEHRGKGVHYALLRALLKHAALCGKTKVFTAVSLFNVSSWKSHVRMGWRRSSTIGYFRPYFTMSRLPWQFTPSQYPVHVDWKRHAWVDRPNEVAQ